MYKELFTDVINGITQTHIRCDYEFLKNLKKIKYNRPAGEVEEDYEEDVYFKREKSKGSSHRNELVKQFKKNGFRPNVKTFVIGLFNGEFYLEDGQNTKNAIVAINEASIKENGKIIYNDFKAVVNHFDNYWDMVDDMRVYNTCLTRWTTSAFTLSADKGEVRKAMLYIRNLTNLQEDQCTKLLFGDLNKSEYEHKTMNDARTYWINKTNIFAEIYKRLSELGDVSRAKKIMSGDGFIAFNVLLDNIYNYPAKNKMFDSIEEEIEWGDNKAKILVNIYCSATSDGFQRYISLNKNSNGEIPYARQKWYRLFLGRLFKNDKGCKEFYSSDRTLKRIIDDWGTVKVSNPLNDPNYLKALPQSRI